MVYKGIRGDADAAGLRHSKRVCLSVHLHIKASAATPTRRGCGQRWRSLGNSTPSSFFPPAALLSRNFLRRRPPRVRLLPPKHKR